MRRRRRRPRRPGVARDFSSPQYVRWRKAVFARDGFACRLCGGRDGLNAHHIKRWAAYPALRFAVSNGVTLCGSCHEKVRDREEEYESAFLRLVRPTGAAGDAQLALILMRHADQEEQEGRPAEVHGPP